MGKTKEFKRFSSRDDMVWDYTTMGDPKEPTIHSPVGASSASRWINCPGSNNLIAAKKKEYRDRTGVDFKEAPKEYTSRGTVTHRLGEQALLQLDFINLSDDDIMFWLDAWEGTIVDQDGFEIDVNEDMVEAVYVYVMKIREIMLKHNAPYEYMSVERSFVMDHVDPEARGTTDCMIEIPFEVLYTIDLKAGKGVPVEVKSNPQCKYYSVGGYYSTGQEVDEIVDIIVQPLCFHPDGPVREDRYLTSTAKAFSHVLKKAIEKTRKKTAPLKSGYHCRWCPSIAKADCPEIDKRALTIAQSEFKTIDQVVELPAVASLPIEKLIAALEFGKLFKDWQEAIYSYLHNLADQGIEIPGHKLVAKKANRAWENEEAAKHELEIVLGAKGAYKEPPPPKLLTPAMAEKAYKKLKRDLATMPAVTKPDNGTVLVPNEDIRKAIEPMAFKAIEIEAEEVLTLNDL